jgi:hypothetical protein
MAQIFSPSSNTIFRVVVLGALMSAGGLVGIAYLVQGSPYVTKQGITIAQTVPFSHEHHVKGLGLDCRYCHTSVETEASAGMPATQTCMTCHSQVWNEAPMLAPVRESLASGKPLSWTRVHDLPQFVYFHHGIHVQKGIGCSTCHGPVDKMPLVWKNEPMSMSWCLQCHKDPSKFVRPVDEVFNMAWTGADLPTGTTGDDLVKQHKIAVDRMTDCSVCHR